MEQPAHPGEQQQQLQQPQSLLSLPDDLVRLCLGAQVLHGDQAAKRGALASCKALALALARTSLSGVLLDVDIKRRASFAATVELVAQLWGDAKEQRHDATAELPRTLTLFSSEHRGSPGRCLAELHTTSAHLAFMTRLVLKVRAALSPPGAPCDQQQSSTSRLLHAPAQDLTLGALLPPGVGALLPNLQDLQVQDCMLKPAARAAPLDAACGSLRSVEIEGLSAGGPPPQRAAVATAQLRQLAKLPSLSSVELKDASCPTLFLLALATQLTRLHLDDHYRQCLPDMPDTPAPAWRATLEQVARCTRLRELAIPCGTVEDLGLLAPALQQLRHLELNALDQVRGRPGRCRVAHTAAVLPQSMRTPLHTCARGR